MVEHDKSSCRSLETLKIWLFWRRKIIFYYYYLLLCWIKTQQEIGKNDAGSCDLAGWVLVDLKSCTHFTISKIIFCLRPSKVVLRRCFLSQYQQLHRDTFFHLKKRKKERKEYLLWFKVWVGQSHTFPNLAVWSAGVLSVRGTTSIQRETESQSESERQRSGTRIVELLVKCYASIKGPLVY